MVTLWQGQASMSFFTNLARPRIKTNTKRELAADVWEKCTGCGQLLYQPDLPSQLFCCHHCGYHLRWKLADRLLHLWDDQSVKTIAILPTTDDPLQFKDRKKYKDRLKEARATTGQFDAALAQHGTVLGQPLVIVALNFEFMAGSMSRAVGQAIVTASQYATSQNLPLLAISASGGARMQESTLSLMQMARATAAIVAHKQARLPYLTLLTDPTTGGVTASFAMQGDVILAEPGALIGFAGPRVIQQTIGQTLPEGFQTAEYLLAHGMVDQVVSRANQRETLKNLLSVLTAGNKSP
jgi:acetyl-CoA carboxylase carboxyl transferase subunit beta